jgi:putative DNA primase/helicase
MAATVDDQLVASHPYSQLKGIDRAYRAARGSVSGSLLGQDTDCLIVPLSSPGGQFKGVECIGIPVFDKTLKKHVTPKMTFGSKGCLILGNTKDKSLPVYIVEGFSDAVSAWRMFGDVVVVAVFGGIKRQEFYAQLFDQKNPDRRYIIIEDAA